MKSDVAVRVEHVAKDFHLPRHHSNSLKETITQVFKPKDKGIDVHHALKDISFEVKKGEFFGILGRNGSGKSTLLKIISEIYRPTRGTVEHNGTLVSFIELGVGFKPELSGRENVFLNGALLGFSKAEIREMYDEIVEFAELEEFMEQKLKNFSSGMKVRLAFSVAIRAKADILILDEVLAVGDAAFQKKCNDYFESMKDESKTVILVTHSMKNVRRFCNRAIVIDQGRVIFDGLAEGAADEYLRLFDVDPGKKVEKKRPKIKPLTLDKKVIIENVKSNCTPRTIEIDVDLRSETREKDVKLAVRVLNSYKRTVAGVNTQSIATPMAINFEKNEKVKVKFTVDNILGDGEYSLNVVTGPTVVTGIYHDSINEVAHFTNSKPEGHYPIVAPATVDIIAK